MTKSVSMPMPNPVVIPPATLRWLSRSSSLVWWLLVTASLVLAAAFGALHGIIVPKISDLRPYLEAEASKALGTTVSIESIAAKSGGGSSQITLSNVRLFDGTGRQALVLPTVHVALSPASLMALRFDQLVIDAPVLDARRTANGRVLIAGLDFSRPDGGGSGAADWFFSQAEFVIRGGTIRWTDEQRNAPPLSLTDVLFVARNKHSRHDLRLDAKPDISWGDAFSVSGEFRQPLFGVNSGDWRQWQGEVFANFPLVDLAGLRKHLDLGVNISRGRGAVRAWAQVNKGQISTVTSDLAIAKAQVSLDPKLENLDLEQLTGRVAGALRDDGVSFSTKGLQFRTTNGLVWPGGNVSINTNYADTAKITPARGEFSADLLDLAALRQIATSFPLGTTTLDMLQKLAPQGIVQSVSGRWLAEQSTLKSFQISGKASGLAAGLPGKAGFSGLTADFSATQLGGSAKLSFVNSTLTLPGVFEQEALAIQSLSTDASWKVTENAKGLQRVDLKLAHLKAVNADFSADAELNWHTSDAATSAHKSLFPGVLDLTGKFARLDAGRVHRYLPMTVSKSAREYVENALQKGSAKDLKFVVKGDLYKLPFVDPKDGEFRVTGPMQGVTLAYVPSVALKPGGLPWPPLTQLSGVFTLLGPTLSVTQAQARVAGWPGLQITRADASITNLFQSITVAVSADAKGPLAELVGLVNNTPLLEVTNKSLSVAQTSGPADVRLRMNLPVGQLDRSRVAGTVTLAGNDVRIAPESPKLVQARGAIVLTEQGFGVPSAQARMLGGDVKFDIAMRRITGTVLGTETVVQIRGQGNATAKGLQEAGELGFLSKIAMQATGTMDYTVGLQIRRGAVEVGLSSDLRGLALNLPAPLGKAADVALPLKYENSLVDESLLAGQKRLDQLKLQVGQIATVGYVRDVTGAEPVVRRGTIGVGLTSDEAAPMPESGVLANINFAKIDLDAWSRAFSGVTTSPTPSANASLSSSPSRNATAALSYLPTVVAVRAKELQLGGRSLNGVVVGGSREGLQWRANLDARELSGYVEYRQPSGQGAGRVFARLSRANIAGAQAQDMEEILDTQPIDVPALDLVIEDFELKGKKLGRLEVDATNRRSNALGREDPTREWRLNRLNLLMPEATFSAQGNWAAINAQGSGPAMATAAPRAAERRRTVMNFKLELRNSGDLLKRLGVGELIRGGSGNIEGQTAWIGSPFALDYPSLSGQLNVNVESGQFLKVDPGLAKLLGVLSLQSLPRRLSLDFRDVFSEGFAFDFIRGDATIAGGIASTNNLQMKGVNAAVLMEGSADIAKETQDMTVRVIPEINAGTASLIATAINPAIGLGTFLAQWVLRRPLILATTQSFRIEGKWIDPKITKIDGSVLPAP